MKTPLIELGSGTALLAYDALILTQVNHLAESHYAALCDFLDRYLKDDIE